MTTQYEYRNAKRSIPEGWTDDHGCNDAVAIAIHAIAGPTRSAHEIWAEPTQAEYDHVRMAVENYLDEGLEEREPDGRYCWGAHLMTIPESAQ